MMRVRRIVPTGLFLGPLLGLGLALLACSQTPPPASARPLYRLGGAAFDFAGTEVLQTWPMLPVKSPPRFFRLALQMSPASLVAGLPADSGSVIQIDVLAPGEAGPADRILATAFTDWRGREAAQAGTRYHYDPRSKLQKNGGKAVYVRLAVADSGLEALQPSPPSETAPEFFLRRAGGGVDAAIDCRAVLPQYGTGEYCSLRRQIGVDYGYRVLFRRDLLPDWARIDAAARDYLARAAARGGS